MKENYEYLIYSEIVNILERINKIVDILSLKISKSLSTDKEGSQRRLQSMQLCKNKSLYEEFLEIHTNLAFVIRFYVCNISKIIES